MDTNDLLPKGITVRQLRIALTWIDNQEMTIRQLRRALFDLDNQDTPIDIDEIKPLSFVGSVVNEPFPTAK